MAELIDPHKPPLLSRDLFLKDPVWFKGAVAYRLLRIMTPKPLTRRLPRILRAPLLMPGFILPPDWTEPDPLPPSLILPPGETLPDGWLPGDPLPEGSDIDTSIYFPDGWQAGDPLPPSLILPPGVTLPDGWQPGDPLPEGAYIDTSTYFPEDWTPGDPPPDGSVPPPDSFSDIPGVDSPVPPIYTAPSEPAGPLHPYTPPPAEGPWYQKFDNTHWTPWDANVEWNASLNRWEAIGSNLFLEVIGAWADGYRPTKMRVFHEGTAYTDILLEDDDADNIATAPDTPTGTELDLTFDSAASADDILWLSVMGDYPHITNIEFYVA